MRFLKCLKSAGNVHQVNDEEVISLSNAKFYVFSDSVLCLGNMNQILLGCDSWNGSKIHHNTELWTQPMENRWNSCEIFSQDSLHWSLSVKSKSSGATRANPNNSKDELSSCRGSMTSYGELKTMKRNVLLIPHFCLCSQKDFQQDVGHSSDLFGENGHPVFRATSPFSRGTFKSKGGGKLSIHFYADGVTIESFLSISSVSTEQPPICVKNTAAVKQEQ